MDTVREPGESSRIEPLALPPLMLVQEYAAQLGELLRRVFERREH